MRAVGSVEIEERLASRGSIEIYLGRQPALDRRVELLKLRRDLLSSEATVEHFAREARLAAGLIHPNVQQVFDLFCSRGDHYLVRERVEGASLRERLDELGAPPPRAALYIFAQLASGLAALHERGLIHADLRPDHVLVSRWGEVKLSGLGHGRTADTTAPPPGPAPAAYSAPELRSGDTPTMAADVYALGRVAAELFSGRRAPRPAAALIRQCTGERTDQRPTAHRLASSLARAAPEAGEARGRAEIAAWLWQPAEDAPEPSEREPSAPAALQRPVPRPAWVAAASAAGVAVLLVWGLRSEAPEPQRLDVGPPAVDAGPRAQSPPIAMEPAQLRFAVFPWAEIQVDDGAAFLTPSAHALALGAGVHQVRLSHPTLGEVRREIELAAGEQRIVRHVFGPVDKP